MKKHLLLWMLVLILLVPVLAVAQESPTSISYALNDLSARVGHTVTLNDLDNWTFEQQVFPDTSLGCPQPDQSYVQVQTVGVIYKLTYMGAVYDYRVTGDGGIVILCNQGEVVPPCPPPDAVGYLPPRLTVGEQAQVGVGGVPNNVRELPGSSSRLLGEIPSEGVFTVVDGPTCSTLDKVVWWKVDYNGLVGWTAESKDGEYYVDPIVLPGTIVPTAPPLATPTAAPQVINSANAAQVKSLYSPPLGTGVYAVSADGQSMAIAQVDGSVILYDVTMNVASAPIAAHAGTITTMTFATNAAGVERLLFTSGSDGMVRLWDVAIGHQMSLLKEFTGAQEQFTTLAYNPIGLLAVGGDKGSIYLFDVQTGAMLATLTGHTAAISDLSFSSDGTRILSVDVSGVSRVWGIPTSVG